MFGFGKKETEEEDHNEEDIINMSELFEQLEYMNSYLAQLNMVQGELLKQQTIANALHILDSEINSADRIMSIDEILEKKKALFGEIFVDYRVNEQQEENNG